MEGKKDSTFLLPCKSSYLIFHEPAAAASASASEAATRSEHHNRPGKATKAKCVFFFCFFSFSNGKVKKCKYIPYLQ